MATDETEEAGLYLRYADGSMFEVCILRCENRPARRHRLQNVPAT